jgi:catechol 2,3-dioxygenase-like lactoylglutathione lyase family enzyme
MSTTEERSDESGTAGAGTVDKKLEVIVIPVADAERAKEFYSRLGWRLDADAASGDDFRIVQFTPPGSDARVSGPAPEHGSHRSFVSFSDPDGNGWLYQEVTTRLPGRVDQAETCYASANDLADAMRRASVAHGEHEKRIGAADPDRPHWYARYMVAEQAGTELPT